ncbi:MAG: DUF3386 family protein [Thermoleophilia bacterium]|nr:DUF3386 family protein [Thermoleophilia bacterium]
MTSAHATGTTESPVTGRLRAAHEGVYRWPDGFPGFTADLLVTEAGQEIPGRLTARSGAEPEVAFRESGPLSDWAAGELVMMVGHRAPRGFEEADGRYAHRAGDTEDGALRIHIDDPLSSSYLVDDDGRIVEVTRSPGATTFSIRILEAVTAPTGGRLSSVFSVSFWEPRGVLDRVQTYQADHRAVAGVMLPSRRHVVTTDRVGVGARTITLTGHAVLADRA